MKLLELLKTRIENYMLSKGLAKAVKTAVAALMGLLATGLSSPKAAELLPKIQEALDKARSYGLDIHVNLDSGQLEKALFVLLTSLGAMLINLLTHKGEKPS